MKHLETFLLGAALAMCLTACKDENAYRIEGTVGGAAADGVYCLTDLIADTVVDTAVVVEEGVLRPLKGSAPVPRVCGIFNDERSLAVLVVEPGEIFIRANDSTVTIATGTLLNVALQDFHRRISEVSADVVEGEAEYSEMTEIIEQTIAEHKADVVGLYLFLGYGATELDLGRALKLGKALMPYWRENKQFRETLKTLTAKGNQEVGQEFTDFAAKYKGKTVRLSDYVGQGNYVLIHFWASWSEPSRAQVEKLAWAHDTYKDRGLVVLGIPTWDEPEETLKAVAEDSIPYPQMLNAQKAGSDAYGITGIPQIILFDPDGFIVGTDILTDNLDEHLFKIFGK